MKVLIVNQSESNGGAAVAANRLARSLREAGCEVEMLVMHKTSKTPGVTGLMGWCMAKARFVAERVRIWLANGLSKRNLFAVSIADTGRDITRLRAFREADVVHMHWVNQGMMSVKDIRRVAESGKRVVWTMHDMWPLTGICHHSLGCKRYKEGCGECRLLRFPKANDLSRQVLDEKRKAMAGHGISFVAVSDWLADMARESVLLRDEEVSVIPNSILIDRFPVKNREEARRRLGIEQKMVVVFGAQYVDAPIKGLNYLLQALETMRRRGRIDMEQVHLLLFGGVKHAEVLNSIPCTYTYTGPIATEEALAEVYAAGNVLVSSSLYETFGQTVIEAMACGAVPVAFDGSGQASIIRHKENGYLAEYLNVESLADGIEWALTTPLDAGALREYVASRYASDVVARQYIRMYNVQCIMYNL